jgi:Tfp pilus assembly protein PilN
MTEQLTEELVEIAAPPEPAGPVRIPWALVPRVNLLPVEILEGRRFRRTQLGLGVAILGTVLVAGGATYLAQRSVSDANHQLASSQARVSSLQIEQKRYAAVPEVIAEVDAANKARTLALGTDVLWYRYLNNLDGARPSGVQLTGFTVTLSAAPTTSTAVASANPLSPTGLGSITFSGTAKQYSDISAWLEALNKITGLSAAALASAAADEAGHTFSSSAVVDSDALSGRYEKEAG